MFETLDKTTQEVLLGLEKTQKDFWNVPRVTGQFLNSLVRAQDAKNVLEIGTSNGYSGIWLGLALKALAGVEPAHGGGQPAMEGATLRSGFSPEWSEAELVQARETTLFRAANNPRSAVVPGVETEGTEQSVIAQALKKTGRRLITIEFYEKRRSVARENFAKCGLSDYIETLQGPALELIPRLPQDYMADFIFIDANKAQYVEYFKMVDKHLRPGGLIACDNVLSHEEKCKPFIDAINAHPSYYNVILPLPAGLSLARKKNLSI